MTAQQAIIDPACKLLGLIAAGRTMATGEYADCLDALNALLDMSTAEEDLVYQLTHESFLLTGAASYTMGPAGTFATVRPTRIRAAVVLATSLVSQPVQVIPAEKFADIEDRSAAGLFADWLTCDYAAPASTLYLNPAPTGGNLELWSIKPLANFVTVTDAVALPPGYPEYLKYNLAVALSGAFAGAKLTDAIVNKAQSTKAGLAKLYRQTLGDPFEPVLPPMQQQQQQRGA